jgi:FecR protein
MVATCGTCAGASICEQRSHGPNSSGIAHRPPRNRNYPTQWTLDCRRHGDADNAGRSTGNISQLRGTISLVDGSQLTLSESTAIVVDQSVVGPRPADSIVNLFKGKLRSVINLRGGSLPDFEVHTPNAVAGVRGTDFETEYIEGKPCPGFPRCLRYTDVGVYKGVVEVRNRIGTKATSVLVSSGYETTVPCELPPANPGPLGMGNLSAPGYH